MRAVRAPGAVGELRHPSPRPAGDLPPFRGEGDRVSDSGPLNLMAVVRDHQYGCKTAAADTGCPAVRHKSGLEGLIWLLLIGPVYAIFMPG